MKKNNHVSYREKKYICGDYMDIQIYPVYPAPRCRRERRKPTSEVQEKLNSENAVKHFHRMVKTNFLPNGIFATLTYTDEHITTDPQRAKKDMQNFLRRLKRVYKKAGAELKYIWIMECAKKTERIHFHLILSDGVDRDVIENVWGLGYANTRRIKFDKNGAEGLVYYMLKGEPILYRRWSCSKNLKKSVERQCDSRVSAKRAKKLYEASENIDEFKRIYPEYSKLLKKYDIASISAQRNEINGDYYLSISLYEGGDKSAKRGC